MNGFMNHICTILDEKKKESKRKYSVLGREREREVGERRDKKSCCERTHSYLKKE